MKILRSTRRQFLRKSAGFVALSALAAPSSVRGDETSDVAGWLDALEDPVRKRFSGKPDLDTILGLFPRTKSEPAFDPAEIAAEAGALQTNPKIDTGHPFLDLSVRVGLAHIDATFDGDHPKYGVGVYERPEHDGFPPTIIATIDALSTWDFTGGRRRSSATG